MQYFENVEHREYPLHFSEKKLNSYQPGIICSSKKKKSQYFFLCFRVIIYNELRFYEIMEQSYIMHCFYIYEIHCM